MNDSLIRQIKRNADSVPDYRHPSYVRHLPGNIIMIVFFAILGNANEWGEIESFAKKKEDWLHKYLELPYGIPTDDTFRIVIGNINTDQFFHVTVGLLLHTAAVITGRKGDYVLALKGNQPLFYEEVMDFFDEECMEGLRKKKGCPWSLGSGEQPALADGFYI